MREPSSDSAFTFVELMVVIAFVGIMSAISIVNLSRPWQQEQLNIAGKELAAWLDERRNQAIQMRNICKISIDSAQASLKPSGDNLCGNFGELNLRSLNTKLQDLSLSVVNIDDGSPMALLALSPRGSTTAAVDFKLALPKEDSRRCVRLSKPLALIRIGKALDASSQCSYKTTW